jgi:hypothetical protein
MEVSVHYCSVGICIINWYLYLYPNLMFADQKLLMSELKFGLEMGHADLSLFRGRVQSVLELAGQYIERGHDNVAGGLAHIDTDHSFYH